MFFFFCSFFLYKVLQNRILCHGNPDSPNKQVLHSRNSLMFYPLNRTTIHDISSLLSLFNASATSCLAAFCGSLVFLAISIASSLLSTWIIDKLEKEKQAFVCSWIIIQHLHVEREKARWLTPSIDHRLQGWETQYLHQYQHIEHQDLISSVIWGSCLQKHEKLPAAHLLLQHLLI